MLKNITLWNFENEDCTALFQPFFTIVCAIFLMFEEFPFDPFLQDKQLWRKSIFKIFILWFVIQWEP